MKNKLLDQSTIIYGGTKNPKPIKEFIKPLINGNYKIGTSKYIDLVHVDGSHDENGLKVFARAPATDFATKPANKR